MWKHTVVLANSVKHDPGRCIAGREISSEDDDFGIGPWIRPVSKVGEGELYPRHFILEDGSLPQLFDVIEIYVDVPGNDITQPENWSISGDNCKWKRVHKWDIKMVIETFVENPMHLWLQPGVKSDRVTKKFLADNPPKQSLYLLDLKNVRVIAVGRKHRISFSYNGINYDLAITDPLIRKVVGEQLNSVLRKALACVSLAPAFLNQYDGVEYHYKLAAMVISYE